jgi:hypothetical protein
MKTAPSAAMNEAGYTQLRKVKKHFGFSSDNDLEILHGSLIIKQASFPLPSIMKGDPKYAEGFRVPCAKVMGDHRGRKKASRPNSVVNISVMSLGSLSSKAIESLWCNRPMSAQHRRRRSFPLSQERWRVDLADWDWIFWLPR